MITKESAEEFAREWIEAWNSHDLERVLSHYSDDFEMSSPFIVRLTNELSGTLKGKVQVGDYWRTALQRLPDLHFELREVLIGVDSITLYYQAMQGLSTAEVFFLDQDGKVYKSVAHYLKP